MTTAARLSAFFKTFEHTRREAAQRDLPARLAELFARLRLARAYAAKSVAEVRSRPAQEGANIDEARLRAFFTQLAGPIEQARRTGQLTDVWEMSGLGRNEVRTAAALAALWNPRLCGAIAVDFLAAFLNRLEAHENLPSRAELAAAYTIRTEDRPLGRADERVDIVVEGANFLLGVEVKIDAAEGHEQLSAYRNALQARAMLRHQRPALIYLSRKPPLDPFTDYAQWADLAAAAHEIVQRHATWTDVATAGRSTLPRQSEARLFVHQLVAQFAAHIASF